MARTGSLPLLGGGCSKPQKVCIGTWLWPTCLQGWRVPIVCTIILDVWMARAIIKILAGSDLEEARCEEEGIDGT